MARKPRIEFDGAFYHVITRGNQRQKIFKDKEGQYSVTLFFPDNFANLKSRIKYGVPGLFMIFFMKQRGMITSRLSGEKLKKIKSRRSETA